MEYQGEPVEDVVRRSVSASPDEPLVFLMGPYRLLDPGYLYPGDGFSLPPDPLAPGEDALERDLVRKTLEEIATRVTEETQAKVFIATDFDVPTKTEVAEQGRDEPGMAVIEQSIACARASAGSAFVFTKAGLTTGVGAEAGAIPEHFRLRDPDAARRDPRTLCLLVEGERDEDGKYSARFSSASIDEMDEAYRLRFRYFDSREDLVDELVTFVESYVIPLQSQESP